MVAINFAAGIALLASVTSAFAVPLEGNALEARQATLPPDCTDYCSVSAGCVCIVRPTNCVATYLVQPDENCGTIVDRFNNFTATDLLAWNPEIGKSCFGLIAFVPVCIGVTGYKYPGPVKARDTRTPEQIPVPVMPGIVPNCTKFEYVDKKGVPALPTLLKENGITKVQWNKWNFPSQDENGDWAEWAQFFNCVAVHD